jgi:16S rRNA (uracil1498-N3)-methyltransferase
MEPRFFAPALGADGGVIALPADEAEHLTRVLRLGVGASVRVFDGRGAEWRARVVTASRRDATVACETRTASAAEPRVRLALAQAILKGDKLEDLIRDAVMLGVTAVQPLFTQRTEVRTSTFASGARLERWQRIVVSSVKQCGRAVVPDLAAPETFESCLARGFDGLRVMLVEPGASCGAISAQALGRQPAPAAAQVFVGPEGGWDPDEVAKAASAGVQLITLGARTLRADATPLIALGVLQYLWGDL